VPSDPAMVAALLLSSLAATAARAEGERIAVFTKHGENPNYRGIHGADGGRVSYIIANYRAFLLGPTVPPRRWEQSRSIASPGNPTIPSSKPRWAARLMPGSRLVAYDMGEPERAVIGQASRSRGRPTKARRVDPAERKRRERAKRTEVMSLKNTIRYDLFSAQFPRQLTPCHVPHCHCPDERSANSKHSA
jgi:hypothetical protein